MTAGLSSGYIVMKLVPWYTGVECLVGISLGQKSSKQAEKEKIIRHRDHPKAIAF